MSRADLSDVGVGYLIAKHGYDLDQAEEAVRTFDLSEIDIDEISFVKRGANQKAHVVLWKSDDGVSQAEIKTWESREAAYRTASSRVLAQDMAAKLCEYNPSLTPEQALARTYEMNPQLYAAELSVSDLMDQRQTRIDEDRGRFA
jgi:hypothetical protein